MTNNTPFTSQTAFVSDAIPFAFKHRGLGFFFKLSTALFVLSLLLLGGSFVYKRSVEKEISSLSSSLERAKNVFDLQFISQMENLGRQIPIVKDVIATHRFTSRIFKLIEEATLKELSYSNFSYSYQKTSGQSSPSFMKKGSEEEKEVIVSLDGKAKNYTSLVQQAGIFQKNSKISSFSFSNFFLTPEGNVTFSLNLKVNPVILYAQKSD